MTDIKNKFTVFKSFYIQPLSHFVTALLSREPKQASPERRGGCRKADGEVYTAFIHI